MTSSGPNEYPQIVEEDPKDTLLAFEKIVQPAAASPVRYRSDTSEPRLNISVVFTSAESTVAALKKAGSLADSLGARITLVVPQLVPYPRPLDEPPVHTEWNESRFEEIASQSSVETTVTIYLCRDRFRTLNAVLRTGSIVVVGCRNSRWPTSEVRLARKLRELGHEVILTEAE